MTSAAFGVGAYSLPEAAKLLRMQPITLRRWLYGYDYDHGMGAVEQPPLWTPQYDPSQDGQLLGFRDLIEARIVNALRGSRIGLPTIRLCIGRARDILGDSHPFSTSAFKTDGRRIFLEITEGVEEPHLIDLKDRQHLFRSVVLPSLSGLDFGTEGATRWWLVPERKTLVADPERSFGQPIIAEIGLLTSRVAQELKAEGSADRVARLYEIPVRAVRDALKFESDRSFKQAA